MSRTQAAVDEAARTQNELEQARDSLNSQLVSVQTELARQAAVIGRYEHQQQVQQARETELRADVLALEVCSLHVPPPLAPLREAAN